MQGNGNLNLVKNSSSYILQATLRRTVRPIQQSPADPTLGPASYCHCFFFYVPFCLPLRVCFPLGVLCRPCPTSWTEMRFWFIFVLFQLCLSALFCLLLFYDTLFSCPVFRLVLSCRPSAGPSPGHIIGLILSANSNLAPSGLGLRPERILTSVTFFHHFLFSFLLFPFCFFSRLPFCLRFWVCHVPGVITLQVIRSGIPHIVMVPFPLRTGTAVHVLICLLYTSPSPRDQA